jgi:hypothetical protein
MMTSRSDAPPCCDRQRNAARQVARLCTPLCAAFALVVVAGCAQTAPRDRDLNAEAIKQMSYWGGEPGF